MLSKIPLRCLRLAVKAERIFVRLAEITSSSRKAGGELLLSCSRGCFCGLGVGFFLFLRLRAPATHELPGYIVGLFLMAGLRFGFSLWVILLLRYSGMRIGDAVSCSTERMNGNKLLLYTQKTRVPVYCPLPDFVVKALEEITPLSERYFSGEANPSYKRPRATGRPS